jgi:hypothetical protein
MRIAFLSSNAYGMLTGGETGVTSQCLSLLRINI